MSRKTTQLVPGFGGSGGGAARLVRWLVALVVLGLVLRDPVAAAGAVRDVWAWGGQALDALATFGAAVSG